MPPNGGTAGRARWDVKALAAQLRLELTLTLRNGESLLLTLGIPVAVLVFFCLVDVLPIDGDAVDFLAPGQLALAVLATAFANLAIATGFDRSYGVLKRLGATPLGRPRLVAAKALAVLVVIGVQVVVLGVAALALGWRPDVDARAAGGGAGPGGRRLHRAGAGARRPAAGAGGPRRRQRRVRGAAAAVGHGVPAGRAAARPAVGGPGAAVDRARRGRPRGAERAGAGPRPGVARARGVGGGVVALAMALFRWEPRRR